MARSNSLPTFFGKLVGINTQDVQATATAAIVSGTQSNCLRPWMMADKWLEHAKCTAAGGGGSCSAFAANPNPWTLLDTYDKWAKSGGGAWVIDPPLAGLTPDEYRAPGTGGTSDPGTGFRLKNIDGTYADYGQFMQMKLGGGENVVSPGWFLAVDMRQVWPSNPERRRRPRRRAPSARMPAAQPALAQPFTNGPLKIARAGPPVSETG